MNPLLGVGIFSAIIYWCFIDASYFKIYFILILAYIALTQIGTSSAANSLKKKLGIAGWNAPNNPQILVTFQWDLTKSDAYIDKKRKESGLPLTLTNFVGFCASRAMHNQPDFNGRLSFGNYYMKEQLDISFVTSIDEGRVTSSLSCNLPR